MVDGCLVQEHHSGQQQRGQLRSHQISWNLMQTVGQIFEELGTHNIRLHGQIRQEILNLHEVAEGKIGMCQKI